MRKLIKAMLLLLVCATAFGQGTQPNAILNFNDAAALPYKIAYPAYANDVKNFYTLSGVTYNGQYSVQALKYNTDANKWELLSKSLLPKVQSSAAYVPSMQSIYIFGGMQPYNMGLFYNVEKVNTVTGATEIIKVKNPLAATHAGIAVWNDKIYLFGGTERGYGFDKMYQFDPATNKFTRLASMPLCGETNGTIVNGTLYTFGGYDEFRHVVVKDIYAYNIASNKWTKAGALPEKVSAVSVAQWGNNILLSGSYYDLDFMGYYDTNTHQFQKLNTNIKDRRFAGSAVFNNKLYVFAGNNQLFGGITNTQVANLEAVMSAQK